MKEREREREREREGERHTSHLVWKTSAATSLRATGGISAPTKKLIISGESTSEPVNLLLFFGVLERNPNPTPNLVLVPDISIDVALLVPRGTPNEELGRLIVERRLC